MKIDIEKHISKIDSQRFGLRVVKINNFDFPIEEYFIEFKKQKIDVVFARLKSDQIAEINKLEDLGFLLKDIQITYRCYVENFSSTNYSFNNEVLIRDSLYEDHKYLMRIAMQSFKNYGHYYADRNLDSSKVGDIYKDWIEKSLTNSDVADKVLVAEYNGEVVGFLSFKIFTNDGMKFTAGGLGAVSENHRNLKIFKDLNVSGLLWAKEIGLDWVEHNVLISNLPVNKVYTNLGFHVKDSFVTLHGWI